MPPGPSNITGSNDLDAPVVLLCFDRLDKPGEWCHRSMAVKWLSKHTGESIPESRALPRPPKPLPTLCDL